MPTGIPKTDAERRADELMSEIERNAKELRKLVSAGAEDARKIEALRAHLNGGSA